MFCALGGQRVVDFTTASGSLFSAWSPKWILSIFGFGRLANRFNVFCNFSQPSLVVGRMDHVLCNDESGGPRFAACEFAVALERGAAAIAALHSWAEQGPRWRYLDWPVDIRFGAADEVWLSQCYRRRTCYIGVCVRHPFGVTCSTSVSTLAEIQDILRPFLARPHWGKVHSLTATELLRVLPKLRDFASIRAVLDPDGAFTNGYLARIFGASHHASPADTQTKTGMEAQACDPLAVKSRYYYAHTHVNAQGPKQLVGAQEIYKHAPLDSEALDKIKAQDAASKHLGNSAWNTGGTWEEKDFSRWATTRLKTLFSDIPIGSNVIALGEATVTECHATVVISRGKKKALCEIEKIAVRWNSKHDAATGTLELTDLSSADVDDMILTISFDQGSLNDDDTLRRRYEAELNKVKKTLVVTFETLVSELLAK